MRPFWVSSSAVPVDRRRPPLQTPPKAARIDIGIGRPLLASQTSTQRRISRRDLERRVRWTQHRQLGGERLFSACIWARVRAAAWAI